MRRALPSVLIAAAVLVPSASAATLKLTVVVKGNGTVVGSPGKIKCPGACAAKLAPGTSVRLTARPASGSTFAGWSGACSGKKAVCTVHLRSSAKATAAFTVIASPPPSPPPPPTPPTSGGFTPQIVAGTWNGTWQNQTFGSSGPASFVVQTTSASSFTFRATLGGNVFGCSTPPPTSGEITPGTGANHWNADGFAVETTGGAGGKVAVAYNFRTNAFTGSGTSGCNPSISWRISGAFNGNSFSGTVAISLAGGSATSVLNLTRS